MVLLIVGVLAVLWIVRRRIRKTRRNDASDALTQALGTLTPYKGRRFKSGRRWL